MQSINRSNKNLVTVDCRLPIKMFIYNTASSNMQPRIDYWANIYRSPTSASTSTKKRRELEG
ncbi:MAG: hypothetical protein ACI90V_001387 [Bacillariaceae sp.]|jgi:hypothetical protein